MKRLFLICICALCFWGCTPKETIEPDHVETQELINTANNPYIFLKEDLYQAIPEDATLLSSSLSISKGGVYLLSGTYTQGITIDVNSNEEVRLVFDNVTFKDLEEEAIKVNSASKVTISLKPGTINSIESTSEVNNLINSKVKLVFNGTGSLEISTTFKNAISSDTELIMIDGNYTIQSQKKCLSSDHLLAIYSGTYVLNTQEGDAIHVTNETNEGTLLIQDGTFTIHSKDDGISSDGLVQINHGTFDIQTENSDDEQSCKGIKATSKLIIHNGEFTFNTQNDALHSNDQLHINDGIFSINTESKGIHADNDMIIDGGSYSIATCDEGLEAKNVTINQGILEIHATDDGINATDGNSTFPGSKSNSNITINQGTITIFAKGDGIDSNGNIEMHGGKVFIYSEGQMDSALDFDGTMNLTGGTLLACGQAGMAQMPTSSDLVCLSSMLSGSNTVKISKDNELLDQFDFNGNYQFVVYASPELQLDTTYHINDIAITPTEKLSQNQMMPGHSGKQWFGNDGGPREDNRGEPPFNEDKGKFPMGGMN